MTIDVRSPSGVRLGARLLWAALAAFLLAVPFTFLLLGVLTAWDGLARVDDGVADRLHALVVGRPHVVRVLEVVEFVSAPWVLRGVTALLAAWLWGRGRRRVAVWLAVTMTAGGVIGSGVKLLVARARPELDDPVAHSGGYSFPSGHALNSFLFVACLLVLAHPALHGGRRALAWAGGVLAVLVVGLDRVALGVHFVSDVVAGWVVAMAIVAATMAGFELWRREEGLPASRATEGLDPPVPAGGGSTGR